MSESKTLILIDGHALAFRQYYALERTNMQTSDHLPTWAVYGFFKAIFDLLKNNKLNADAIAVAFDVSHQTFRTETYTEYKANREAMPDNMQIQMNFIYEGLKAFSIPIYTKEGFEADDVIGTISKRACKLGHKVLILTGDQDSFQLIDKKGCVKVIIPSKGELIEYNWDKVHEKLGVYPNQVIDYKALRGDVSDNIPGINGIGEKTAVKLLEQFSNLDNVLSKVDEIKGRAIRERIRNGVEQARLSQYLATIVRDVDIDFDFNKTKIECPDVSSVTEFLKNMQFYQFLKNIEFILKSFCKDIKIEDLQKGMTLTPKNQNQSTNVQLGLFAQDASTEPQSETQPAALRYEGKLITNLDDLKDMQTTLQNKEVIAIKSFARIENARNIELYGFALGYNDNFELNKNDKNLSETFVYYIPVKHKVETELTLDTVLEGIKDILQNPNIKKITHDIKSELNIYKNFGININGVSYDTMLSGYIKNSSAANKFDIECMENINHMLPSITTENKKEDFSNLDIELVKNYVFDSIASLFELTSYWINKLEEQENKILNNIELPLAFILSDMEFDGVSIDKAYLKDLTNNFNSKLSTLEQEIFAISEEPFNINSPKQVGNILYEKLGLSLNKGKRSRAKQSTNAEVLTQLAQEHKIARLILEYRKYAKLKSNYTEILPELICEKDNRIHTTFNQTITATGRLSSSNPNLQNIPARTEEGNQIRQAFVAQNRQDSLILSADYSQIELRILAHISQDKNLIENFKSGKDVHTLTASKVFDVPVEKVTKSMRYSAKAVNFGIVYGQTKYGLAKSLNITPEQAGGFIDKYFETYPNIKLYMQSIENFVKENGYVETIFGRKRFFENEINSSNSMVREFAKRAAINHPVQGSASDLIKLAMIDFKKSLAEKNLQSKLIMQVHDELVIEVKKSELDVVKECIVKAMELDQPLLVPLVVDVYTGESWKEI